MATDEVIERMERIRELLGSNGKTVMQIADLMKLHISTIRRYMPIMVEDGEAYIGGVEDCGRTSAPIYFAGPAPEGVAVIPRKLRKKPEEKPAVRDPMLVALFGEYRRAA